MSESRNLYVVLSAQTSGFAGQMVGAGAAVRQFGSDVMGMSDQSARAMDTIGRGSGKMALGAAAGLAAVAKAAVDWESQWAGVAKTVNGTSAQLSDLEGELREMARTMPATHEEIAATAEAAGQLGVATESIGDFTRVMLMMGETTNLTADDAATAIAQFMNVMGTAADSVDEIGNTIVALGNKGASTEAQIVNAALRLSGAGALLGATEADTLGLASALSNLGIEAELGGGAIQRTSLIINSAVLGGGDKLKAFADVAGESASEFANKWKTDPMMAIQALIGGLGQVKNSGGDVVKTLSGLGIKGTQNLSVLLRLAGSGDMLSTSLEQARDAWEQNNALTKEFAKRAATDSAKIQVAWNNVKDAAIDAGEAALPVIAELTEIVSGLADAFEGLPDPVQASLLGLLAFVAVLGGGVWLFTKVIAGIRGTRAALTQLTGGEVVATAAAQRQGGAIRMLIADLRLLGATAITTAGSETLAAQRSAAAMRMRARARMGLRGGGAMAGIALLSTGATDSTGLSNTASLALMGSMIGGYGAAIGGAIGLVMDMKSANDDLNASIKSIDTARATGDMNAYAASIENAKKKLQDTQENTVLGTSFLGDDLGGVANAIAPLSNAAKFMGILTGDTNDATDALSTAKTQFEATGDAIASMATSLGDSRFSDGSRDLDDLTDAAASLQPALDDLGLTLSDLAVQGEKGTMFNEISTNLVEKNRDAVKAWIEQADSAPARVDAVAGAVDNLSGELVTSADAAETLKDAMDQLLGANLSLSAAQDQWSAGLRELKKDLEDAGAGTHVLGKGKGREAARAEVRERITDLEDLMTTTASVTQDPQKVARVLENGTKALIDQGVAAGLNEKELRKYLRTMGLTPDLVDTTFEAVGLDRVQVQAGQVVRLYNKLPKNVRTEIKTHGFPKTKQEVEELKKKYDLTPKQVETILDARDNGSVKIRGLHALLKDLDRDEANPKVGVEDHASPVLAAIMGKLFGIDRFVATPQIVTHHSDSYGGTAGGGGHEDPPDPADPATRGQAGQGGRPGSSLPPKTPPIPQRGPGAGRYGSQSGRSDRGGNVTVHAPMPARMTLVLDDGTELSGYVRGHARDVARDTVDAGAVTSESGSRMTWD